MSLNLAAVTPEMEAVLKISLLHKLAGTLRLAPPTADDFDNAHPADDVHCGDIVILRGDLRYAHAVAVHPGGLLASWITPHALTEARKRLRPEMLRPDYADIVGQDARHAVVARWVLAERLATRYTEEQRGDTRFLARALGTTLPRDCDPVHFVRQVLIDHDHDLREHGTRERHAETARDAARRPALIVQRVAAAFPRVPEIALATVTTRTLTRDAVRVVPTTH